MPKVNKKITLIGSDEVHYKCDKCNIGFMKPTGVLLPSYPPKYPHKCTFCSTVQNLDEVYPKVELTVKKL